MDACKNTDRELWREREGDYYADSLHVTANGSIGINCGGHVIVKSLSAWHALAIDGCDHIFAKDDQNHPPLCLRCGMSRGSLAQREQPVTPTDPSVSVKTSQSVTADRALFAGAFERLAAVVERDGATGIAEGFRLSAEILRAGKCPEELHRERQPVGGGEDA